MVEDKKLSAHLAAIITNIIWGTTFVATKILLNDFNPAEILMIRTIMGFLVLCVVYPHRLKITDRKQEITYALAGLTGACLYYYLENMALTYTMASNVGVVMAVAPFFTAVMMHIFFKGEEKLQLHFFVGFLIAMVGICLISFNGSKLQLNPLGDCLAVAAALVWALYCVQTRKITKFGYHTIQNTRRIFAYGILFLIPISVVSGVSWDVSRLANPTYVFNFIFLGFGASALCFVSWNYAVKILGAVQTSVYIYMGPVITVVTSMIVLHEQVTPMAAVGTALTLAGLIISEGIWKKKSAKQVKV